VSRHRYLHLDVFTDRPFEGNQLAVFPDARDIDERWMQPLAREIGFSETVFMLPPVAGTAQKRLRIFTPGRELPMAGHPTIGSAFVWAQEHAGGTTPAEIIFELGVGPIRIVFEWQDAALRFAWMHQPKPEFGAVLDTAASAALAHALHLPASTAFAAPPQLVSSGTPFLFAALGSEADVDAGVPDAARLTEAFATMGMPETGVFLFARSARADATLYSRMFAPMFGIQEDPATGGASGPLGAYALTAGLVSVAEAGTLVSLQGAKMGRPSYIHIGVTGEPGRVDAVKLGGTTRFVAEGLLTLP
jgi:trans-2,3-dihydro-3-hydroxyanthranilate isomerase